MKTVCVTGAARGLGLAISTRLSKDGYFVVGIGRRPSSEFDALTNSRFIVFDLAETERIGELVREITKTHGPLYGLVNNAGISVDGVLATQHATDISKVLCVNLEAAIVLTKFASRPMLIKREGRIINISSIIASTGFNGLAVYAASKAGLEGFTRSLARELGRVGICVNCVAPGYMETDMTESLKGEKLESVRRRAPLGLATVDDTAGAVAYLLSPDAIRVTGTIMTVDGGSTA